MKRTDIVAFVCRPGSTSPTTSRSNLFIFLLNSLFSIFKRDISLFLSFNLRFKLRLRYDFGVHIFHILDVERV